MRIASIVRSLAVIVLFAALVLAHSGGLDSDGGHYNRKLGGYHFHRGPLAGQSFADRNEALRALRHAQEPRTARPSNEQRKEQTVYITRTGHKYHRAGCSYLRSRIPIKLSDAISRGYTACSRCFR